MGGIKRVVNRNDGVVRATIINGQIAFENDIASPVLGQARRFGSFLARRPPVSAR